MTRIVIRLVLTVWVVIFPLQSHAVEYTLHQGWNLIGISKDLGSDSINSFISHVEDSGDATVDSIWYYTSTGWKHYISEDVVAGTNTLESVELGAGYWVKLSGSGAEFTIENDLITSYTVTDDLVVDYGSASPVSVERVQPSIAIYEIVAQPSHGTIDESAIIAGEIIYTPNAATSASEDTFSYRVTDVHGVSVVKTVTLSIPDYSEQSHVIRGTVTGLGEGASAYALLSSQGRLQTVAVDSGSGLFQFDNVEPGDYSVKISARGYDTGVAAAVSVEPAVSLFAPDFIPKSRDGRSIISHDLSFDADLLPDGEFVYHWEEDVSVSGAEYSSFINEPHQVSFLEETVDVPDVSAAKKLLHDYNIILSNENLLWSEEHAYRLLETMKSIPQTERDDRYDHPGPPSRWVMTGDELVNDIDVVRTDTGVSVVISSAAFVYASPRIAQVDGKKGSYYSKRLHHALVRYVTNDGMDIDAVEKILGDRYGVSIIVPDYAALTVGITDETADRFQQFHGWELVEIINMFEEMPTGFHVVEGLDYLVRRVDGQPHPIYADAPAVAWTERGYIEFMDSAFLGDQLEHLHRLILHEKSHFLWSHLFSEQTRQDWIELGGWYENSEDSDGWSTTKTTEFVSAYAHAKNPNEDMAESLSYFVINPDMLRSRSMGKYEFIRDRIMQGNIYLSLIREDLTFEVYNLFPDYVYPGKIKRVDVSVTGAPEQDKQVTVEIELHTQDQGLESAQRAITRIYSEIGTYEDLYLYPVDESGNPVSNGSILRGQFTLSKFSKAGFWYAQQFVVTDSVGNQRFEGVDDYGWKMYVNNPLEDVVEPTYVRESMALSVTEDATSYQQPVKVVRAEWEVDENKEMKDWCPCYASINPPGDETYRIEEYGCNNPATGGESGFFPELSRCVVEFVMTNYFVSGSYELNYIRMIDQALNDSGFYFTDQVGDESPQTISIESSNPDTVAPELDVRVGQLIVSAEPTHPEAPDGETVVTIQYYARDDKSGLGSVNFRLRDPQGVDHFEYHYHDNFYTVFFDGDPTEWKRYEVNILLPAGSPPGIWGLSEMTLSDKANNFKSYDFTETIHFDLLSDG